MSGGTSTGRYKPSRAAFGSGVRTTYQNNLHRWTGGWAGTEISFMEMNTDERIRDEYSYVGFQFEFLFELEGEDVEDIEDAMQDFQDDLADAWSNGHEKVLTCGHRYMVSYYTIKRAFDEFLNDRVYFPRGNPQTRATSEGRPPFIVKGDPQIGLRYFAVSKGDAQLATIDNKVNLQGYATAKKKLRSDNPLGFVIDDYSINFSGIDMVDYETDWILFNVARGLSTDWNPAFVGLDVSDLEGVANGNGEALNIALNAFNKLQLPGPSSVKHTGLPDPSGGDYSGRTAISYSLYFGEKLSGTAQNSAGLPASNTEYDPSLNKTERGKASGAGNTTSTPQGMARAIYATTKAKMSSAAKGYARFGHDSMVNMNKVNLSAADPENLWHGTLANKRYNLKNLPQEIIRVANLNAAAGKPIAQGLKQLADRIDKFQKIMYDSVDCLDAAAKEIKDTYKDFKDDIKKIKKKEKDEWFTSEMLLDIADQAIEQSRNIAGNGKGGHIIEEMAQEKNAARIFFREQCYLLGFIRQFSLVQKDKISLIDAHNHALGNKGSAMDWDDYKYGGKRIPYFGIAEGHSIENPYSIDLSDRRNKDYSSYVGNACIQIDGDPYGFLNKLTMDKSQIEYLNIDNFRLSYLQPKIRLFKIIYDQEGTENEVEVKFDTHFSKTDLQRFMDGRQRGAGVGVKSFEFTYDGSNPFAAKKSIKAKLKVFSNTFDDLMLCRGAGKCEDPNDSDFVNSYRYVDLALKTFSKPARQKWDSINTESCAPGLIDFDFRDNIEMQKLNFRLKAHIGIELPDDENFYTNLKDDEILKLKDSLNASCVTLNLTPTVHTFDLDDMGRVVMEINYLAYIEDFYDSPTFNIFSDPRVSLQRFLRQAEIEAAEKTCESEELEELRETHAQYAAQDFRYLLTTLISRIIETQKMKYYTTSYEEISRFTERGPFSDIEINRDRSRYSHILGMGLGDADNFEDQLLQNMDTALDIFVDNSGGSAQKDEAEQKIALALNANYQTVIPFFYLADLVDSVLEGIQTELDNIPDLIDEFLATEGEVRYGCLLRQKKEEYIRCRESFKKIRILLGPAEFVGARKGPNEQSSVFVNLGDIPISTKYFVEWMTSKFLKKNEIVYSLSQFMNDVINNLVNQFLNGTKCPIRGSKQKVRLNQASVTGEAIPTGIDEHESEKGHGTGGHTPIGSTSHTHANSCPPFKVPNQMDHYIYTGFDSYRAPRDIFTSYFEYTAYSRLNISTWPNDIPILRPSGLDPTSARTTIGSNQEINYMIYFVGQTMPIDMMKGMKSIDEEMGVYHYMLGRDRGLVKNIKLQKTATPGLAEVRFEQEGYNGLEQLRVVYDAEIETYANVNTFPGTYIFIEPAGFSPSAKQNQVDLTRYGIGGYYMIVRSHHLFAEGKLDTRIEAKWVNQLDSEEDVAFARENAGDHKDASKCRSATYRYEEATLSPQGLADQESSPIKGLILPMLKMN